MTVLSMITLQARMPTPAVHAGGVQGRHRQKKFGLQTRGLPTASTPPVCSGMSAPPGGSSETRLHHLPGDVEEGGESCDSRALNVVSRSRADSCLRQNGISIETRWR